MKRKLLVLSAKRKVKAVARINFLCVKIQAMLRGMRGRRLVAKMFRDKLENKAALTIQNFYWSM
jgi:hypothetical protein